MKPSQVSYLQFFYAWLLLSIFAVSQLCPGVFFTEPVASASELDPGNDGIVQMGDYHPFIALPSETAETESEGESSHEPGREFGSGHQAALNAHHEALNVLYGCSEAASARGHSAFQRHSIDVPLFVFHHAWKIHLG